MEAIFLIILNLGLCFLVAKAGENRKIGFGWSLVLCVFLSPIIGGIITMLSAKKVSEETTDKNN